MDEKNSILLVILIVNFRSPLYKRNIICGCKFSLLHLCFNFDQGSFYFSMENLND